MKLTGAEILCESLTRLGVREIFGYPGGAILPVYDALGKSKLHHVLVRHVATPAPVGASVLPWPPRVQAQRTWLPGLPPP